MLKTSVNAKNFKFGMKVVSHKTSKSRHLKVKKTL